MIDRIVRGLFWVLPLLLTLIVAIAYRPAIFAQGDSCATANTIDQTLPTGARWEMCWHARDREGIVLHDIYYTTSTGVRRKVLKEAGLAQIHVAYDDGGVRDHLVTDVGLGGDQMATLNAADCPDGTLHSEAGRTILCQQSGPRGYDYKYYGQQRQGGALTLYSAANLGTQSYIVQWQFLDNGIIEPALGRTGQLPRYGTDAQFGWPLDADGTVGVGFVQNVYWRLDFEIGETATDDVVEEFNVAPADNSTRRVLTVTPLTSEAARTVHPENKRSWRIRDAVSTNSDGHAISYHLEPMQTGHSYLGPDSEPWTQSNFFVTVNKPCERFISHNPTTDENGDSCGDNVTAFVNGESLSSADVVLWYGLTRHFLPRDEDEPFMNTQWDAFQIYPRDWTAQNPL